MSISACTGSTRDGGELGADVTERALMPHVSSLVELVLEQCDGLGVPVSVVSVGPV